MYTALMSKKSIRLESAEEIRSTREGLGLSQEASARLMDVALITFSRWERGVVEPSTIVLRGISAFFEDYRQSQTRGGKK